MENRKNRLPDSTNGYPSDMGNYRPSKTSRIPPPPEPPLNGQANHAVFKRHMNGDASSTSRKSYEKDVTVLNRCFDDIERFFARLQHAAAARRELERSKKLRKSKKKEQGDELLFTRAPPSEAEYIDIFQKFKLSFNLLAKLKSHIYGPNAPELVHSLLSPLTLMVEASHESNTVSNLPARVVAPLLTYDAIELLSNCLSSKETELWHSLGDAWRTPKDKWNNYVVPYVPTFMDGWTPNASFFSEEKDENKRSNTERTQYSNEFFYDSDRGDRRSHSPPPDRNFGPRSDISNDSIEKNSDPAARFEHQQRRWLADLKARNAKIVQVAYPRTATDMSNYRKVLLPAVIDNSRSKLTFIDENLIGKQHEFDGPFGRRRVIYCDYTASGKPLHAIESYIMREVLPVYGNTHTTTSITSVQTTVFRDEARDILRHAVGASEKDALIFVGSGCTGAVHKLVGSLCLAERPIIFIGASDHHSNILPWREIASRTIRIQEDLNGLIDTDALEHSLKMARNENRQLIGCFSAASNITGTLYQDMKITALLHRYGALSFWDYATAAPYVKIAMNPTSAYYPSGSAHKDAIYFSMHKFVGGVQTPGILVVKKSLLKNSVPHGAGGGTVLFVDRNCHVYLSDVETREEGGTPAIVENIRAGLAMKLKENVTAESIMEREENLTKLAFSKWLDVPELIVLGSTTAPRLAIFSFVVRHLATGYYLHHNFVSALLNDIYGIQARGGCACAGPYTQDLLGIDENLSDRYAEMISKADDGHSYNILKPGFTRLNLPYFATDSEISYIVKAVIAIAQYGWTLLPFYRTNVDTGEWHYHNAKLLPIANRKLLADLDFYVNHKPGNHIKESDAATVTLINYEDYLQKANDIFRLAKKDGRMLNPITDQQMHFHQKSGANELRWFLFPNEGNSKKLLNGKPPFTPRQYAKDIEQPQYHLQHYSTIPTENFLLN